MKLNLRGILGIFSVHTAYRQVVGIFRGNEHMGPEIMRPRAPSNLLVRSFGLRLFLGLKAYLLPGGIFDQASPSSQQFPHTKNKKMKKMKEDEEAEKRGMNPIGTSKPPKNTYIYF